MITFPAAEPPATTVTLPSTTQTDGLPIQLFASANPKTDVTPPVDAITDEKPVEVGLLFRLSDRAKIKSLRFWSSAGETGSRRLRLWDVRSGALLKEYTVTAVNADAWNDVALPASSVILPAGQYIVSILCQNFYPARDAVFNGSQVKQGILEGINGVYNYETNAGFKFEQSSSFYYIEPIAVPTGEAVPLTIREHIKADAIFLENLETGDFNWQVTNQALQAETAIYSNSESVTAGETLEFHIHGAVAGKARLEIHRLGYYNGSGAKRLATTDGLNISPQPKLGFQEENTRLTHATWAKTHGLVVPNSWRTGIYQAKVTLTNGINAGKQSYTVFVVRDDTATAEILYQVDTNTWDAYNLFNLTGGARTSLYSDDDANGRAFKVSKDRPYAQASFDNAVQDAPLRWNPSMVYFLERFGYRVAYCTNWDIHRFGASYIQQHRVFLTNGHDEYWSQEQYAAVKAARDTGVNLINSGANTTYWRVRYENNGRTVVCYKNNTHGGRNAPKQIADPISPTVRFRELDDAECRLWGVQYVNDTELKGFAWKATNVSDPLYQNTGFQEGDALNNLMGYEWDNIDDGNLPPLKQGTQVRILSTSLNPIAKSKNSAIFVGWKGNQNEDIHRIGQSVFFQNPSGAYIFSTGANNWSWGLAPLRTSYVPDFINHAADDMRLQRLFQNILTEMKVWGAYPSLPILSAPATTSIKLGEVMTSAYRFGVPSTGIVPNPTDITAQAPYSFGHKFTAQVDCQLSRLMVYIPAGETGNHSIWVWNADNQTKIQEFPIANNSQDTWVDVPVSPGIALKAGKNYLISTNRNARQVAINNVYRPPLQYGSFTYQGTFFAAQQNIDTYPNQALTPSPELFLWFEVTASSLTSTISPTELKNWKEFPAAENIELGTRFTVSENCKLLGISLLGNDLKDSQLQLDFTLWDGSTQAQIQRVSQQTSTTSGQGSALAGYRIEARFSTPIALSPNTTYVVSVNLKGAIGYLALGNAFANGAITRDIIRIEAGVFNPTPNAFPSSTFQKTWYSLDVIIGKTSA